MDTGALEYLYGKDKLPKGWSYPLKRSALDVALQAAGIARLFSVRYSYGAGAQRRCPLRVQFDGDEPSPFGAGLVSITFYAVPSVERRSTMAQLESRLTAVCDWIRRAETGPPTWRMTRHELTVEVRDGQARVPESP